MCCIFALKYVNLLHISSLIRLENHYSDVEEERTHALEHARQTPEAIQGKGEGYAVVVEELSKGQDGPYAGGEMSRSNHGQGV